MYTEFAVLNDFAHNIINIGSHFLKKLFIKKYHEIHVPTSHNDFNDYLWRIFVLISIYIENEDKNYLYEQIKKFYHLKVPDDFESAKLHLEKFEDYIITVSVKNIETKSQKNWD